MFFAQSGYPHARCSLRSNAIGPLFDPRLLHRLLRRRHIARGQALLRTSVLRNFSARHRVSTAAAVPQRPNGLFGGRLQLHYRYLKQCIIGTWNNALQVLETMHYRYLKQCITGTWNNALQVLETMHYRYLKQYITGTWNNTLQVLETMHYRYLKQCITGTWNNALQVLETMHFKY